MTTPTTEQQRINDAQAALDKQRIAAQQKAAQDMHDIGKRVQEQLVGVPMSQTNVNETVMVVLAVLALKDQRNDTSQPAQPAATS